MNLSSGIFVKTLISRREFKIEKLSNICYSYNTQQNDYNHINKFVKILCMIRFKIDAKSKYCLGIQTMVNCCELCARARVRAFCKRRMCHVTQIYISLKLCLKWNKHVSNATIEFIMSEMTCYQFEREKKKIATNFNGLCNDWNCF